MVKFLLQQLTSLALLTSASLGLNLPSSQYSFGTGIGDLAQDNYQSHPELSQSWGQYSPWFNVPSEISPAIPPQCNVSFAQILSRHGSRYPSVNMTKIYGRIIHKIHQNTVSYSDDVSFLQDYKYSLGGDDLTTFGQHELMSSGRDFFKRYSALSTQATIFVRAAGQERVVVSARNWTQGFHAAKYGPLVPYSAELYPIVVIEEDDELNNTLSHDNCVPFRHGPLALTGSRAKARYTSTFIPSIRSRLNGKLRGANLTDRDTIDMMDLCPYNTVATPTGTISPFCDLFTSEEWQKYDYAASLEKYYGHGAGNPLAPTQGVGYANELIARLTGQPVEDHTNTNRTLDENPDTFPLGLSLYADFSHDNDMTDIFFALGLYNSTKPLSQTSRESVQEMDGYSAATTVPFAARAYFEKLRCSDHGGEEMVRILVNGRVLPLRTCGGDHLGRCLLRSFVNSLSFAKQGGHWEQCYQKTN